MYFSVSLCSIPLLLAVSIASPATLEKRLTRSKLDQFSSDDCDGNYADGPASRSISNVNIQDNECINMDGRTHSIYLSRGTGLAWRRHMEAYEQTGCPDNKRIEGIGDRDPAGPCVDIDTVMLGVPGSDDNQGRLMSVKFTKF